MGANTTSCIYLRQVDTQVLVRQIQSILSFLFDLLPLQTRDTASGGRGNQVAAIFFENLSEFLLTVLIK
jgi:hypothetical protein